MKGNTRNTKSQRSSTRKLRRQAPDRTTRFTTLWGWFTAPRFGAAGSGGLEYEPLT